MFLLLVFFTHFLRPELSKANEDTRLYQHAQHLKSLAESEGFNTEYAILVDMSKPSRQFRYFVVNLKTDSVVISALCAHGGGKKDYGDNVVFSNVSGSLLSSEGRYLVGSPFNGTFGLSYKLYGIDETNSNALTRGIVLHAYHTIPDKEVGKETTLSNGCPMVSPNVFNRTAALIDNSELPILLWIYK